MQEFTSQTELKKITDNTIYTPPQFLNKAKIVFHKTGNILFCEEGVRFSGLINFAGSNSVVYLSKNKFAYNLNLTVWDNATCYFGKNNYFNGALSAIVSERRSLLVGNDCLFSFGIWMRTADPHLIYDCSSRKRINPSKDILIGDHVWIGQDAKILKGAFIGSGSIIAAGALASGKEYPSNCSIGGIPAKVLNNNVFFSSDSVHAFTSEQTEKSQIYSGKQSWIYDAAKSKMHYSSLLESLQDSSPQDRLAILNRIRNNKEHNRFAIANLFQNRDKKINRTIKAIKSSFRKAKK